MMSKDEHIEKLVGSENYHTWSFAMKNLLEMHGWETTIEEVPANRDANLENLKKAKAKLVLNVDSSIYVHIQSAETAAEIWKKLKDLYEDRGLSRKIGLLRKLITTRLESSDSMMDYVNQIIVTANKLTGIGFDISEEWLGAILLAGLTDEFMPMIMGIESSGVRITGDAIKSKLLDTMFKKTTNSAFIGKKKNKSTFTYKCYKCKRQGHKIKDCPNNDKSVTTKEAKNAFHAMLLSKNRKVTSNEWYIDSGASQHMTPNRNLIHETKKTPIKEIVAANNAKMMTSETGKVILRVNKNDIEVNDVLHVPDLLANLLSISKIVKNGNTVIFDKKGGSILNANNKCIAQLNEIDGVYKLHSETTKSLLSLESTSAMTWHRRLGHINHQDLRKMRDGIVNGVKFPDAVETVQNCEICSQGKQTKMPFKKSGTRSKEILGLIHSDLCGPMENASIGGARYFLTFIDDFSRKYFVYFLKQKSEVLEKFKDFKRLVENQTGKKIKVVRTDNGTEYCGNDFQSFCRLYGIKHQTSNTYTPQQNGVAERANRTIVEKAKCMIFDAELHKSYWAEAVNMAIHIINRSVSSVLVDKTPEEVWTGIKVDLSHLKIFGSPVMVHIPKQRRSKWDSKSKKLIFVGYDDNIKGYRCIDPATKKLVISRDVVFHESQSIPYTSVEVVADNADLSDSVRVEIPKEESDNKQEGIDTSQFGDDLDDSEHVTEVQNTPPQVIRRTTRPSKPNPKYCNQGKML